MKVRRRPTSDSLSSVEDLGEHERKKKKLLAGGQVKPCPRPDCSSETCLHCRCTLGTVCGAAYLHRPPCKRCFGGAMFSSSAIAVQRAGEAAGIPGAGGFGGGSGNSTAHGRIPTLSAQGAVRGVCGKSGVPTPAPTPHTL